ncbi:MAG: hypothetical protein IKI70_00155, partial [Bacteroidales bacterium]|nr:hypothetical protein [Bacteroidales bacterium]
AVRPVWTSEDTFYFQAHEAGGDAWYKVTMSFASVLLPVEEKPSTAMIIAGTRIFFTWRS